MYIYVYIQVPSLCVPREKIEEDIFTPPKSHKDSKRLPNNFIPFLFLSTQ